MCFVFVEDKDYLLCEEIPMQARIYPDGHFFHVWQFLLHHGTPTFRGFSDAVNGFLGLHLFYRVEKVCGKDEVFFTICLSRNSPKGGKNKHDTATTGRNRHPYHKR